MMPQRKIYNRRGQVRPSAIALHKKIDELEREYQKLMPRHQNRLEQIANEISALSFEVENSKKQNVSRPAD